MSSKNQMGLAEYKALVKGKKKKKTAVGKRNAYIDKICAELTANQIPYHLEYRFDNKRGWRFDVAVTHAVPNGIRCIGIEFNGGQWNAQQGGKSRHTNGMGYAGDLDKINAAQVAGWRVLQFTTSHFSKKDIGARGIVSIVKQILFK